MCSLSSWSNSIPDCYGPHAWEGHTQHVSTTWVADFDIYLILKWLNTFPSSNLSSFSSIQSHLTLFPPWYIYLIGHGEWLVLLPGISTLCRTQQLKCMWKNKTFTTSCMQPGECCILNHCGTKAKGMLATKHENNKLHLKSNGPHKVITFMIYIEWHKTYY